MLRAPCQVALRPQVLDGKAISRAGLKPPPRPGESRRFLKKLRPTASNFLQPAARPKAAARPRPAAPLLRHQKLHRLHWRVIQVGLFARLDVDGDELFALRVDHRAQAFIDLVIAADKEAPPLPI